MPRLSPKLKIALEVAVIAIVAILVGWSVFAPALWTLAPRQPSFGAALYEVFFHAAPSEHLVGYGIDLKGTVWTFGRVAQMLSGDVGTVADDLFVPVGWDQGLHQGFAWMDAILAWPLVATMGAPGFYNLHILLMVGLSQAVAAVVFRRAGAPLPVALALSLPVVMNPFSITELFAGRPTQVHLIFHGLFLLAVVGLLPRPSGPAPAGDGGGRLGPDGRTAVRGAVAGALLVAACLVYWFSGIAVGLVAAIAAALTLLLATDDRRRLLVGGTALVLTAVPLAALPTWRLAGPVMRGEARALFAALQREPTWTELAAGPLTIPIRDRPLQLEQLLDVVSTVVDRGMPPLLLVAGGLALVVPGAWRRALPWAVGALFVLSMSLGPAVQWADRLFPTGFALTQAVFPPMERCLQPARTVVGAILGFGLAAAMGAGALMARVPERWRAPAGWILGLALAAVAVQGRVTEADVKTGSFKRPQIYDLAATHAPGGIIDVPLERSSTEYVYQLFHGQPLLGGPTAGEGGVWPEAHQEFVAENSFLVALEALGRSPDGPLPEFAAADLDALHDAGFRAIVVHGELARSPPERFQSLLGVPYLSDGREHVVFPLPRVSAR